MTWETRAACTIAAASLFFGGDAEPPPQRAVREQQAKILCAACPVRVQCLECALVQDVSYGIWGGLSERERRNERRRRAARSRAA
jgi:WhiB family transcriptional regulator, redox-sensing transcriptional regulator